MGSSQIPDKSAVIAKLKRHEKDTGSPEVQVSLLTKRIEVLSKHFETHPNDEHSKRGLHRMVSQRKNLLGYLKLDKIDRYRTTLQELGLRK